MFVNKHYENLLLVGNWDKAILFGSVCEVVVFIDIGKWIEVSSLVIAIGVDSYIFLRESKDVWNW